MQFEAKRRDKRLLVVHQFGHHPSIVLWNAHNEPFPYSRKPGQPKDEARLNFGALTSVNHQLPSWNRSILDRAVKRIFGKADTTRPSIAHWVLLPTFLSLMEPTLTFGSAGNTATHRDLNVLALRLPRLVRFVSEFGAQALPADAKIAKLAALDNFPHIDTEALANDFGAQLELLEQHTPN